MRHSVAANRTSHAASLNSQANSATAASKLLEKKKEFDAVSALERASTLYLERIEGLGEDCDIMADAGRGIISLSIPLTALTVIDSVIISSWASARTVA
jgi:hypothetical protein